MRARIHPAPALWLRFRIHAWPHWRPGVALEGSFLGPAHTSQAIDDKRFDSSRARPRKRAYDEACTLLTAAQGIRAAAGPRRSAPAIAASLGCVEASLDALATAVTVMRVAALEIEVPSTDPVDREVQIRAGLDRLTRDFQASRLSSAAAREVVGPVLANH